jgi:hypothetical protein
MKNARARVLLSPADNVFLKLGSSIGVSLVALLGQLQPAQLIRGRLKPRCTGSSLERFDMSPHDADRAVARPQLFNKRGHSVGVRRRLQFWPRSSRWGLYFVWFAAHSTQLAALVGIGRGADLILYLWVCISLILLLNLHLKLRTHMELLTILARKASLAGARLANDDEPFDRKIRKDKAKVDRVGGAAPLNDFSLMKRPCKARNSPNRTKLIGRGRDVTIPRMTGFLTGFAPGGRSSPAPLRCLFRDFDGGRPLNFGYCCRECG